jgi:phosphoribosylaminoimidazole-succinocarboxamide synthase
MEGPLSGSGLFLCEHPMPNALHTSALTSLPLLARGKVRDNYAVGSDRLLMVASDRLSAFDVILGEPIAGKGKILTQMALFWFDKLKDLCPNHLTGQAPEGVVTAAEVPQVAGRSMLVKRLKPIPVEAVVRGYLAGSGWQEYQRSQSVCGVPLQQVEQIVGPALAAEIRRVSIAIYERAAQIALTKGIIIADTKFEFGLDQHGTLTLMDEVLTPDSSRYWPIEGYEQAFAEGSNPPSYDKQFVRDWLEAARINGKPWDKTPPAPALPPEVAARTAAKYQEALVRLTGSGA